MVNIKGGNNTFVPLVVPPIVPHTTLSIGGPRLADMVVPALIVTMEVVDIALPVEGFC